MRARSLALLAAVALSAGCYHATIETGATPSTVTVEKSFASSWIAGLVPPSTVELAGKCTSGVAKVETQLSFVNMLVGFLTFSIYTPMSIKVTCAQGGMKGAFVVPSGAGVDQQAAVLNAAAEQAITRRAEVLVEYQR